MTTSEAKAARIREAGADEVIVVERGGDFSGEVRRLTGGRGVDVTIDNVGSPVFESGAPQHGRLTAASCWWGR